MTAGQQNGGMQYCMGQHDCELDQTSNYQYMQMEAKSAIFNFISDTTVFELRFLKLKFDKSLS